jgi:hypothetical protein
MLADKLVELGPVVLDEITERPCERVRVAGERLGERAAEQVGLIERPDSRPALLGTTCH